MKRTIFVMGILISIFTITSCLENDDTGFIPTVAETNNSNHYGKDGDDNDSIPPDSTSTPKPPTGGQQGQNPIRP